MGAQTGTYPEQLTITNDLLIGDLILLCRDNKIFRINPSLIGGGGGSIGYTPEDSNNRDDSVSGLSNLDSKYPSSGLLTNILSRLGRTIENEITDPTYTVDPSDVTALGEVLVVLTNTDPIACTLDSPNALGKLDGYKVTIVQGGSGVVTVTANLTSFKGAATTSTTAEFYWEGETKTFIATAGATAWRVIGG